MGTARARSEGACPWGLTGPRDGAELGSRRPRLGRGPWAVRRSSAGEVETSVGAWPGWGLRAGGGRELCASWGFRGGPGRSGADRREGPGRGGAGRRVRGKKCAYPRTPRRREERAGARSGRGWGLGSGSSAGPAVYARGATPRPRRAGRPEVQASGWARRARQAPGGGGDGAGLGHGGRSGWSGKREGRRGPGAGGGRGRGAAGAGAPMGEA